MGRDLVIRKAEGIWESGIVEQVSLDLQNEFPEAKGFSARNLWSMKKWYSFYALAPESYGLLQNLSERINSDSIKLHQVGAEMSFPTVFGFVPWRHHVEIISRCKSVEEALFYVQKTIEEGLSRSALIDIIKADLYHNFGAAITNFSERLPVVQGKLICCFIISGCDVILW